MLDNERPGNRVSTLRSLAEAAQRLLSADLCAVQSVNPITDRFYGRAILVGEVAEEDFSASAQKRLEEIAVKAIKRAEVYVEDLGAAVGSGAGANNLEGFSTIAATVFQTKREQKPVAVLFLGFRVTRQLSNMDVEMLGLLVSQYSPIVENLWLLGRYREVVNIGQTINQNLDKPQDLFIQLYKRVSAILDTKYFFMLAVYHQQNQTLDYHIAYKGKVVSQDGKPLRGGCAYAIERKESLIEVNRTQNPSLNIEFVSLLDSDAPDPESLIFVPLIFRGEPLGVLSIQHLRPNAFDNEDLQLMNLLSNQVALALSDLRLFRYLKNLNDAGQQLTSQLTSERLLDDVVELIHKVTKSDIVTLYPYINNTELPVEERFGSPHMCGEFYEARHIREIVRDDDIAWLLLQKAEPLWADDSTRLFEMLGGDPATREGFFERREQIRSTVALALHIEGEAVGALFINYRHPQLFKAPQRNLILGLASYAAIAIKNNRQFKELSVRRIQELEALREIDIEISSSLNVKDVLNIILKRASERVHGAEASIVLFNPHTQRLETQASLGSQSELYHDLSIPVDDEGIVAWVYRNKTPARVNDVWNDPEWREKYRNVVPGTMAELDVPLKDGDEVVGVICFESPKKGAFSEADEVFLVTLAGQAVLAVKNAQVYERAEAGKRSRESLHEVAKEIIGQQGDPERVMRLILSKARFLIGSEIGFLQLYEQGRPGKFYFDSKDPDIIKSLVDGVDIRDARGMIELGIVRHVAESRKSYRTHGDAHDDKFYKGSRMIHSEVAVPLLGDDEELVGVLDLESPRPFAFDDDDEMVLDLFGGLAVIAIKNARDYSRARLESERFRLLSEAGQELGEVIEAPQLGSAYDTVVRKVGEFSSGEVVIRRYDETTEELLLARVGNPRPTEPLASIPKSEGINGQVALEHRTICVHDVDNLPPGVVKPIGDDPSIKTLVVTPLMFEKFYYGNLVLSDEKAYSIKAADVSLLEGLARQLANTIHRLEIMRAKHEAEQHAKNLRVMGEVGQSAMEIAHRLGNELIPVDYFVSNIQRIIAEEGIENDVVSQDLNRVAKDVKNLLNMAKGLRHKISDLGKPDQERSTVPVKVLLDEAAWSLHEPEHIKIIKDIEPDLPDVSVVPGQVIDILRNLFQNSVDAMSDGGTVTIRASYPRLQPGASSPHVMIDVVDTGPGILPEDQPKVFNLFFSKKKSSGFGLWSARQYARANGGDLLLNSSQQQGAAFTLKLPVAIKREAVS
jgi:two-component system NtrC family sensor kinase